LGAELHEIAFPVAEEAPIIDGLVSFMDGTAAQDRIAAALEITPSSGCLGTRQIAVELLGPNLGPVDLAIDRLMAHPVLKSL